VSPLDRGLLIAAIVALWIAVLMGLVALLMKLVWG